MSRRFQRTARTTIDIFRDGLPAGRLENSRILKYNADPVPATVGIGSHTIKDNIPPLRACMYSAILGESWEKLTERPPLLHG